MSCRRTKSDSFLLISLSLFLIVLYFASFYITKIEGVGINNLITTIRFLLAKLIKPLLIGTFIGGILSYVFPHKYTSYFLGGRGFRPLLNSLWIGIFSRKCFSENLNNALVQFRTGVPLGASLSCLLMSSFNSFSSIYLIIALFGFKNASVFYFSLALMSFSVGLIFDLLQYYKYIPKNEIISRLNPSFYLSLELKNDLKLFFNILKNRTKLMMHIRNIISDILILSRFNLKWILISILLSGIIEGAFPENIIVFLFNNSFNSELIILLIAFFLSMFSEGLIILGFLFFHMSGAFGTVFVFLLASILWRSFFTKNFRKIFGTKTVLYFLFLSLIITVFIGFVLN